MLTIRISARDRRAVALGVFTLAVAFMGTRALPWLLEWRDGAIASSAEALREYDRMEGALSRLPATLDSLQVRRSRLEQAPAFLIQEDSKSSAVAAVSARIAEAAARAGAHLGAVQVRPDTASSSTFTTYTVTADASGDFASVGRMLRELEAGPPVLSLHRWSLAQSRPPDVTGGPEQLQLEFTAVGLMRVPPTPGSR